MDDRDRFDLSFRNSIVRMWFYIILPTIVASAILLLILPPENHPIVMYTGYIIL